MAAAKAKQEPLVRFVSPFGSPAWMTKERAQALLEEHDARWLWLQRIEAATGEQLRSEHEREVGPPRIERVRP